MSPIVGVYIYTLYTKTYVHVTDDIYIFFYLFILDITC